MYLVQWAVQRVQKGSGGQPVSLPLSSLGRYRVVVVVVTVVDVVASQRLSRFKQMNICLRVSKKKKKDAAKYCTSRPLMLSERTAVSIHVQSILIQ